MLKIINFTCVLPELFFLIVLKVALSGKMEKSFLARIILVSKGFLWLLDSQLSDHSIKYEFKFPNFTF